MIEDWRTRERQEWQRDLEHTTDREIYALAAAIHRLLEWQHNKLQLKHEATKAITVEEERRI